ncbi:hypothetical protein [Amycolatopsis sp. NPDC049868]|uniref:hypothetical protein n=1 Tax=Amycolatopsis sp. NPDC049868 TaxID=3363934 RepID=UPI0037B5CF1A
MGDQTQLDPAAVREAANRIGNLMDDGVMQVFNKLDSQPPTAGKWEPGQALQRLVEDRIRATQAQADILATAFRKMCDGLRNVADHLENADGDNSDQIKKDIQEMKDSVANGTSSTGASSAGDPAPPDEVSPADESSGDDQPAGDSTSDESSENGEPSSGDDQSTDGDPFEDTST